jgi:putative transcriptional regulator
MKKQLFNELVESIREAGKIHRGEKTPSRRFVFQPEDVRSVRETLEKSQSEIARVNGGRSKVESDDDWTETE